MAEDKERRAELEKPIPDIIWAEGRALVERDPHNLDKALSIMYMIHKAASDLQYVAPEGIHYGLNRWRQCVASYETGHVPSFVEKSQGRRVRTPENTRIQDLERKLDPMRLDITEIKEMLKLLVNIEHIRVTGTNPNSCDICTEHV